MFVLVGLEGKDSKKCKSVDPFMPYPSFVQNDRNGLPTWKKNPELSKSESPPGPAFESFIYLFLKTPRGLSPVPFYPVGLIFKRCMLRQGRGRKETELNIFKRKLKFCADDSTMPFFLIKKIIIWFEFHPITWNVCAAMFKAQWKIFHFYAKHFFLCIMCSAKTTLKNLGSLQLVRRIGVWMGVYEFDSPIWPKKGKMKTLRNTFGNYIFRYFCSEIFKYFAFRYFVTLYEHVFESLNT